MAVETPEERAIREAEEATEEEERSGRKEEKKLKKKISRLENCKSGVGAQIESLKADRARLDSSLEDWGRIQRA